MNPDPPRCPPTTRAEDIRIGDRIVQHGISLGTLGIVEIILTVTGIEQITRQGRPMVRFTFDRPGLFRTYRSDDNVERPQ